MMKNKKRSKQEFAVMNRLELNQMIELLERFQFLSFVTVHNQQSAVEEVIRLAKKIAWQVARVLA